MSTGSFLWNGFKLYWELCEHFFAVVMEISCFSNPINQKKLDDSIDHRKTSLYVILNNNPCFTSVIRLLHKYVTQTIHFCRWFSLSIIHQHYYLEIPGTVGSINSDAL